MSDNIQTLENIWEKALQNIQSELSEQSYKTWFEIVTCKSFDDNILTLVVPDKFYGDWLQDHYQEIIKSSVLKVVGEKPEVIYKVEEVPHLKVDAETIAHEVKQTKVMFSSGPASTQNKQHINQQQFSSHYQKTINRSYTFDNFVVGPGSRFAHAAAVAISESPAKTYNPLFVYGRSGLGKTHLLQSIANEILIKYPDKKVLYTSSEEFTNHLISSIQNKTTNAFRQKFRSLDILLIDDIQFIAGKESTQEEFFHTFNALYDAQKQIVLSSDRSPKEIPSLEQRLLSRFEWGLITDVQPPDFETRVAILKKKLELESVSVSDEILFYIAENIKTNIRELEGALIRVCAYATLTDNHISLSNVKQILKSSLKEERKITIDLIQQKTAEYFNLKAADLRSKRRTKTVAHPRQIAMYLSRKFTAHSFPEIGEFFGGRGHATVVHACNQVALRIEKNDPSVEMVPNIKQSLFSDNN